MWRGQGHHKKVKQAAFWGITLLLLISVAACAPTPASTAEGPRLLAEETLIRPSYTPLILPSTLSPSATPISQQPTSVNTLMASNPTGSQRLITQTPAPTQTFTSTATATRTPFPSPTRTVTPSLTPTATITLTPSITFTATTTFAASITPLPNDVRRTGGQGCTYLWFFTPIPPGCPSNAPSPIGAAFQAMEGGMMFWLADSRLIYLLFDDGQIPAWVVLPDSYEEGMPPNDASLIPPTGLLQPQRGFGWVWRNNPVYQARLGWATAAEQGYSAVVQIDALTGAFYLSGPSGQVYGLAQDLQSWWLVQ